jgi:hypothetical protein
MANIFAYSERRCESRRWVVNFEWNDLAIVFGAARDFLPRSTSLA